MNREEVVVVDLIKVCSGSLDFCFLLLIETYYSI